MRFSTRALLLGGILSFLAACTSTTPVEGDADDMVFPVLRAELDFVGRERAGEEPRSSRGRGRGVVGMEFAASGASDEFQPTGGFQMADFRILDTHAAFRAGGEVDGRFRVEGLTGLEYSNFEIETAQGNQARDKDVSNNFGPYIGAQLTVDIVPDRFSIFGRATAAFGAETESEKLEAGIRIGVSEATQLLVAYRQWEYEDDSLRINGTKVDLSLEMTGIVIGMVMRF